MTHPKMQAIGETTYSKNMVAGIMTRKMNAQTTASNRGPSVVPRIPPLVEWDT